MSDPILRLSDVTFTRGTNDILKDINWTIQHGENWVLFGPNGAGKSTLHNIMLGYTWPTDGTVYVLGETLGQVDVRDLRKSIAIVSDTIRSKLSDNLTGYDVLVTGPRGHLNIFEETEAQERARVEEIASWTKCESLLNKPFNVMSTGEKQRIMIARALTTRPKLLILDEPCAGLDIAGREFVLQAIETVAKRPDAPALIFTTHHIEEIMPSFTHALLLDKGNIFASGKLSETITSQNLSRLFDLKIRVTETEGRYNAVCL